MALPRATSTPTDAPHVRSPGATTPSSSSNRSTRALIPTNTGFSFGR